MENYLGQLMLFAGNFAPVGWLACEGQLIPIAEHDALYVLLGTTYGGDGMNTFGLPDLRGRLPIHQGQGQQLSRYFVGQMVGTSTVTLTPANLPAHTHTAKATTNMACNNTASEDSDSPANCFPSFVAGAKNYANTADGQMGTSTFTAQLGIAGKGQPIEINMPTIAMKYCIATTGVFPSQN